MTGRRAGVCAGSGMRTEDFDLSRTILPVPLHRLTDARLAGREARLCSVRGSAEGFCADVPLKGHAVILSNSTTPRLEGG